MEKQVVECQDSVLKKIDKVAYLNTQLEALELVNQKHEYRTIWSLTDKISERPQSNQVFEAASDVRMLDGSQPNSKIELISDWGKDICKLQNNKNVKVETVNFPEPSPMQVDVARAWTVEQLK